MKNIIFLLAFSLLIHFGSSAQTLNCGNICILSINNLDTTANTLDVTIFNGDTNQVNYPIVIVTDAMGDTVANINSQFYFFAQLDSTTVTHTIPTDLNSLSSSFTGTVYLTDPIWNLTCSFAFPMSCSTGIHETVQEPGISIYPNPAEETFTVNIPGNNNKNALISIVDITGKTMEQITTQQTITTLSRGNMDGGVYFLIVRTEKGAFTNKLILK